MLYRMATGACPHEQASRGALVAAIRHARPVPTCERAPHRPAALGALVDGLLARRAADRPASARAVRAALDALRGAPPAGAAPWRRTEAAGNTC